MGNPIREGLEHMRKHGWTQHAYLKGEEVCAVGALACLTSEKLRGMVDSRSMLRGLEETEGMTFLARVIRDQYPEWVNDGIASASAFQIVYRWNDQKGRTQAEVETVFEKAAILWDEASD